MEIRPIKTEQDYQDSLKRIEKLWGAKKDTLKGDEFDLLCTILEFYEMKHYPISPPYPIIILTAHPSNSNTTSLSEID